MTLLTLPLAAASLALGACGGGGSNGTAGSGDRRAESREAMLDFAKCMREHGVNMPDPQPGEGGVGLKIGGPDMQANKATMIKAEEACQEILERVRGPELTPEQEQKFRAQALKFARCMRGQGIDMPDPTFGKGGRITQRIEGEGPGPGKGGSLGPENPRFRAAMERCEQYGPKFQRDAK